MKERWPSLWGRWCLLALLLLGLCGLGAMACEPQGGCKSSQECKPNEECKSGTCQPKSSGKDCQGDSDCGSDETCDSGKCKTKPTGCASDSDCKPDEECKSGKCETKPPPGCTSDGECKPDETCESGTCKPKPTGCTSDGECKPDETCDNGVCKPKSAPGCTSDSDCDSGKECKDGKCVNKPGPGCGSGCKLDEYCFNNDRCLKKAKECKANTDCGDAGVCVRFGSGADSKTSCVDKCDPTQNTSADDRSNKTCWSGWGWCFSLSQADPKSGGCLPPQSKTRKKDESCHSFATPDKPEYNTCEGDLQCSNGKCVEGCDPSKGTSTNPKCAAGTYCRGSSSSGTCDKLPEKKQGTKKQGEDCSNVTKERFCDGDSGLFCNFPTCAKACDPRKGKTGNSDCGATDECVEQTSYSHLGGVCVSKPSRKEGETCNTTDKRCLTGLNCYWGRCIKACDSTKPQPSDCGSDQWCYTFGKVCTKKCDPANGKTTNAACGKGAYCVSSSTTYKPGYCRPLPDYEQGTKQDGEDCSTIDSTKFCDGSKQLICSSSKCRKACDLRNGKTNNSDCGGADCIETTTSPLGGVCVPKASKQAGEECNSSDKRCSAGLVCDSGRCGKECDGTKPQPGGCASTEWCYTFSNACRKKCDPANGVVGNSACGAGLYCISSSTTYKPGYCRYLPSKKQGPKKAGESCSSFTASQFCDGSAGLTCYRSKCEKACDYSKGKDNNPDCPSTHECQLNTSSSHTGGVCVPKPSQKLNDECNTTDKRCISGLICINFGVKAVCQKSCDPAKTGECGSDKCQSLSSGGGFCIAERKKTRKLHEECGGVPGSPSFDDCDAKFTCAGVQGSASHCLEKCKPASSTCPSGFVCLPLSGSQDGVCGQSCTDKADCKKYGNECRTLGNNKVCI